MLATSSSSRSRSRTTLARLPGGFPHRLPERRFLRSPGVNGLQAEPARLPRADGTTVKVPGADPSTADASLLALSDVHLTGYRAAHLGQVALGKTATVTGDGAVGLSAVLAARRKGAERIILMGRHRARTDLGVEGGDRRGGRARRGGNREGARAHRWSRLPRRAGSGRSPARVPAGPRHRAPGRITSRGDVPQYEQAPIGFRSLLGKNARPAGGEDVRVPGTSIGCVRRGRGSPTPRRLPRRHRPAGRRSRG
jgi:hypothetical protein